MKNIVILYGGAQNKGGIYTYILNLFNGLKKDNKINLHLYSINNWPLVDELKELKFETKVFNKCISFLPGSKYFKNISTIVTMGMVSNFYGRLWGFLYKIPVITIIHSDWKTDYQRNIFKKIIYYVSDRLLRFATSKYVTVSEYLKKGLIQEGVKEDKITVIYNGVFFELHSECNEESIDPSALPQDDKCLVIGSIGRLHPVKNFGELIKSISQVENKNIKLEIMGEGAERNNLENMINSFGLNNKVELLGQKDDIYKYLNKWDVYIQPSLSEGFGLATVEAMMTGLPVIVTPKGSLPEIVEDSVSGFVTKDVNSNDLMEKIEYVINNLSKALEIAKNGQKDAIKKYDYNLWLSNISKLFKDLK